MKVFLVRTILMSVLAAVLFGCSFAFALDLSAAIEQSEAEIESILNQDSGSRIQKKSASAKSRKPITITEDSSGQLVIVETRSYHLEVN